MKKAFLFCLIGLMAAGCQSTGYEYDEYDEYLAEIGCNAGNPGCRADALIGPDDMRAAFVSADTTPEPQEIRFSTPRGNDLVLETPGYILQVEGAPNKKYDYYVWTGEKQYADDPDLIIQEGVAAVLKQ